MRAITAALAAALAIVVAVPAPSMAAPGDGLSFEVATTYELQPDEGRVRVSMDMTLTNLMPDQGNRYFYFDLIGIPVLTEATNVVAERVGGGALPTVVERTDDAMWSTLEVRLSPVLRYGRPQRIRLRYDLPDLPPRSEGWTRANDAYAAFLVHAVGDPGSADVTIVIPSGYSDVSVGGDELSRGLSDGSWRYTATGIDDPEEWWAVVAALDDELLDTRSVSADGNSVLLRSWPGDDEWAAFAEDMVSTGIPVLEELIGLPWPVSSELTITESSAPHVYGYGGWYDAVTHVIEINDELDPVVVLHELSHAWFNRRLTTERWFTEGLAELYAHRALAELEESASSPEPLPSDHPGAQPLLTWEQVPFASADADEYVYTTAWWLLDQVYDEVGASGMSAVLNAAADRQIPYRARPEAEPEEVTGRVDWRRVLDLMQEVAGSDAALDLFREHVLGPDELPLLDDRDEARSSYAGFVDSAGGWPAPLELREAMTLWRFDEVDALVAEARQVLHQRDDVVAVISAYGVDELPALEASYGAATVIADVAADAEAYVLAAETIAAAQQRDGGVGGVLTEVALLGASVDARLTAAAESLAAGDPEAAEGAAARVLAEVEQAPLIGGVLAAQVLVAAGLFWPLRRWRKRRTSRLAVAVGSDPWPTDEPSSSPSTR